MILDWFINWMYFYKSFFFYFRHTIQQITYSEALISMYKNWHILFSHQTTRYIIMNNFYIFFFFNIYFLYRRWFVYLPIFFFLFFSMKFFTPLSLWVFVRSRRRRSIFFVTFYQCLYDEFDGYFVDPFDVRRISVAQCRFHCFQERFLDTLKLKKINMKSIIVIEKRGKLEGLSVIRRFAWENSAINYFVVEK